MAFWQDNYRLQECVGRTRMASCHSYWSVDCWRILATSNVGRCEFLVCLRLTEWVVQATTHCFDSRRNCHGRNVSLVVLVLVSCNCPRLLFLSELNEHPDR